MGLFTVKGSTEILQEITLDATVRCFIQTQDGRTLDLTPVCAKRGPDTLLVTNPLHPMYGQVGNEIFVPSSSMAMDGSISGSAMRFNPSSEGTPIEGGKPATPSTQFSRHGSGLSFSRVPMVGIHEWGYFGGGGGGGGGGGPCDTPDQKAADGSQCGDRAASEKPGGR